MVDIATAPAGVSIETVSRRNAEPGGLAFDASSYVEWPSVFVGAVVALAVAFVLLTFGAAVGQPAEESTRLVASTTTASEFTNVPS